MGKEYAVDRVADMAEEFGVRDVLVDFGRDIRALGSPVDAPCWGYWRGRRRQARRGLGASRVDQSRCRLFGQLSETRHYQWQSLRPLDRLPKRLARAT